MCTRLVPTPEELASLIAELDAKYGDDDRGIETPPRVAEIPLPHRTDDQSEAA